MITFFVTGTPAPQGSKRIVQPRGAKHPRLIEVSPRHHAWRAAVAAQTQIVCADKRLKPIRSAVHVTLEFLCQRAQRTSRLWPVGDIDKLSRGVLDGMTAGGLLADDDVVTMLTVTKAYGSPRTGCTIAVRLL